MEKPPVNLWPCALALVLGVLMSGCASSSSEPLTVPDPVGPVLRADGLLSVHLVKDGAAPQFSEINLALAGLDLLVGTDWRPVPLDQYKVPTDGSVPSPDAPPVELLGLTSASPGVLATKVAWPIGPNSKLRLTFAGGSTVKLAEDDSVHDLTVQKELVCAMGLPGSFNVDPSAPRDLWIALDVSRLVQAVAPADPADPTTYVLVPGAVRGYEKSATGTISGLVTAKGGSDPLAGISVTAQLLRPGGGDGAALAFRTVQTDADGQYTLDLLPLGYTWCVVAQAQDAGRVFQATVAEPAALGKPPYDVASADLALTPVIGTGALQGVISGAPVPGETDVIDLVQALPIGDASYPFVLRSVPAQPVPGAPDDKGNPTPAKEASFSFASVPPGTYYAVLNRFSYVQDYGVINHRFPTAPFTIGIRAVTQIRF